MAREELTIAEVQQKFADVFAYNDKVTWDFLSKDQGGILKQKIKSLIPDPKVTTNMQNSEKIEKEIERLSNIRETFFKAVWDQRKYTNGQSLTSIIYVLVAPIECEDIYTSRKWSCHPVIRTRRCMPSVVNDISRPTRAGGQTQRGDDCCMIFVDDGGRVYQNWSAYVNNNQLPKGNMVAPCRGVYTLRDGNVQLETCVTPAARLSKQILNVMDKTTAMSGLIAAPVTILGAVTSIVAAPVMAVVAGVSLTCAAYSAVRSGGRLIDRAMHEQSNSVANPEVCGDIIGVASGIVGLGAAGASSAIVAATKSGREVGTMAQLAVNGLNATTIIVSGTGVVYGVADLLVKYEYDTVTAMDVLQLSASVVLFTHSASNFKLASTIIDNAANSKLNTFRDTLSRNQRKMFDKVSKETVRNYGASKGKSHIIRNVNEMPSRQQFNDLYKINKQLNQQGVRFNFDPNGKGLLLNNEVKTSAAALRASVQHNIGPSVVSQVTQPIPNGMPSASFTSGAISNPAWLIRPQPSTVTNTDGLLRSLGQTVNLLRQSLLQNDDGTLRLDQFDFYFFEHIVDADSFETLLLSLADNLNNKVLQVVLEITEEFLSTRWESLHDTLGMYLSTESVLYRVGKHVLDNYYNLSVQNLRKKVPDILEDVREYFMSLNSVREKANNVSCNVCSGYYDVCSL